MSARILDGRKCADTIQSTIAETVKNLPTPPRLDVILVGDDAASAIYVGAKEKACSKVGIHSKVHRLTGDTSQQDLLDLISTLNQNDAVDGILLQLPLPAHLNSQALLEHISPNKDVDGFHPYNTGRLCLRLDGFAPCTPRGIMRLLEYYDVPVLGKDTVVIGASNIVGRPSALELLAAGATVTVCHRFTNDLQSHVSRAEVLVVAAGKPNLVPGNWIKPGAVVVDVGVNRLEDGTLCGDVEFEAATERAAWITPVPGGVGPMTIAMLLQHTLQSAQQKLDKH